ncbi:olfactory receptor 51L1-like [Lissotriton helveticus]
MASVNMSNIHLTSFLLMAFPGADAVKNYISLAACLVYLLSIMGNGSILLIIRMDNHLREPMYLLLSMLATTDLSLSLSTLPTSVSVYCFDYRRIHIYACFTQLFCMQTLCSIESAILVAMAFDRYVAICIPLRYNSILQPLMSKIGLVAVIRGVLIVLPAPLLLNRLPYCGNDALSHAFCFHPDVMRLASADTSINSKYGLVVALSTFPLDSFFILLSYVMILKTLQGRAGKSGILKGLNTCVSHICVVLLFYIPMMALTLGHRYGQHDSPLLLVMMGGSFLVIPPALNPVVYSMKTTQIRRAIFKMYGAK